MEQLVPVYHRAFTHAEILELLAFYETSIGRKAVRVLPQVMGESMAVGQKWGESLRPDIERRIQAALVREGLLPR